MDGLDRTDVEALVGWPATSTRGSPSNRAPSTSFREIAARQVANGRVRAGRLHVVAAHQRDGEVAHASKQEERAAREGGSPVALQRAAFVATLRLGARTCPEPVLRHVGDTGVATADRGSPGRRSCPWTRTAPDSRLRMPATASASCAACSRRRLQRRRSLPPGPRAIRPSAPGRPGRPRH